MPLRTYVALIRGINVGRHRRLSMADLREAFAAIGVEDAKTYLQSGNVVLESDRSAPALAARIEKELKRSAGLDVTVMVRTASELARLVERNPFQKERDGKKVHVAFLDTAPRQAQLRKLDAELVAPDEFRPARRVIYLHYPNGYGRSKLTNDYLEKQLGVRSTMRNLTTVTALAELGRGKMRSR
jgi:uncharacterized protein (DUF1697 family)